VPRALPCLPKLCGLRFGPCLYDTAAAIRPPFGFSQTSIILARLLRFSTIILLSLTPGWSNTTQAGSYATLRQFPTGDRSPGQGVGADSLYGGGVISCRRKHMRRDRLPIALPLECHSRRHTKAIPSDK